MSRSVHEPVSWRPGQYSGLSAHGPASKRAAKSRAGELTGRPALDGLATGGPSHGPARLRTGQLTVRPPHLPARSLACQVTGGPDHDAVRSSESQVTDRPAHGPDRSRDSLLTGRPACSRNGELRSCQLTGRLTHARARPRSDQDTGGQATGRPDHRWTKIRAKHTKGGPRHGPVSHWVGHPAGPGHSTVCPGHGITSQRAGKATA
jgi:hypothetical protein